MVKLYLLLLGMLSMCSSKQPRANTPLSKVDANYNKLIYLPKDHKEKDYPLIIYLHGSSHKGDDLEKLKQYGLPYEIEKGHEFDFIVVSPQCPSGKGWATDNWFEPLYEELTKNYRIDSSRVYLTGISMGGGGVFEVAKDHPDRFAALVPLCAWASTTDRICKLQKTPIWTFHGQDDQVVPISETESKVAALQACQGDIVYTRLENEGHGIQWLYDPEGPYDIYEWMLQHKK
jgi:predicted peptidase